MLRFIPVYLICNNESWMVGISQKLRKQLGVIFVYSRKSRNGHGNWRFLAIFDLCLPEIKRTGEGHRSKGCSQSRAKSLFDVERGIVGRGKCICRFSNWRSHLDKWSVKSGNGVRVPLILGSNDREKWSMVHLCSIQCPDTIAQAGSCVQIDDSECSCCTSVAIGHGDCRKLIERDNISWRFCMTTSTYQGDFCRSWLAKNKAHTVHMQGLQ